MTYCAIHQGYHGGMCDEELGWRRRHPILTRIFHGRTSSEEEDEKA